MVIPTVVCQEAFEPLTQSTPTRVLGERSAGRLRTRAEDVFFSIAVSRLDLTLDHMRADRGGLANAARRESSGIFCGNSIDASSITANAIKANLNVSNPPVSARVVSTPVVICSSCYQGKG